jgi:predicted 3-demethylubiquinone-9 3-methyltransferase (glyoxalase superfamily)
MDVLTHLMFQDGRAREAAEWYVSLLPRSTIERVIDNDGGGATVYFTLAGRGYIAFDSPVKHGFDFTPSISIFVECDNEEQVRSLFAQVALDGDVKMPVDDYGFSSCFGWATDRYAVSWQMGTAD